MASNLNSGVISETCGDLPTSKDSAVDKTANRKGFEDTVSGMNCSSQRELNRSKDAVNLASGFSSDTSHSPAAGARCAEESMKECYSDVHRARETQPPYDLTPGMAGRPSERSALPRPMPSAATQHGEGSSSYPYCADESRDVRAVDIEAAFGCRSSAPFTVPHPTNTGCEQRAEDGCLEGYQRRQRGRAGESHSLEPEEDGSNYIRRAFDRAAERGSRIVFEPAEGMIFSTEQEAYQFYNTYSWEMGFGIKYGNKYEIKKTGYKTNQDFLCSCEVSLLCHSSFNFFF
ncbi:uncharacterized protein LOC119336026 isoform X1 [Triticum dicoccoides]|uniref:uncharacterized protein LOC119336026 isoform X1 n=1 Tax=Triticum dicoccoides TaxID=85692 RepID=UPI001890CED1|nr:uncharacterized protein LOC119336026 isoform X1 [Triticum dicoccoides]